MRPDTRVQDLLGIELPILLAPMAGAVSPELAIAVAEAGGLGSLPCAMLSTGRVRAGLAKIWQRSARPINLNFYCHHAPAFDLQREMAWRERLAGYYLELGLDPKTPVQSPTRTPFDGAMCDLVIELRPEVVSFHFGLPDKELLAHVKDTG